MAVVETIRRRDVFVDNGFMLIFDAFSADKTKRFTIIMQILPSPLK